MKLPVNGNAPRSQVVIAIELLESLNQAMGGCEQVGLMRRDPRFLLMRDGLYALKAWCIKTLPKSIRVGEREKKIYLT